MILCNFYEKLFQNSFIFATGLINPFKGDGQHWHLSYIGLSGI